MKKNIIRIIILFLCLYMLTGCFVVETRGPHNKHGQIVFPIIPVSDIEIEIK